MGVWGMSMSEAYALTDRQAGALFSAYLERKRFEAKLLLAQAADALQRKPKAGNLAALASLGFGIEGLHEL